MGSSATDAVSGSDSRKLTVCATVSGFMRPAAGATPAAGRMKPETVAHTVSFLLTLPDTASVAELPMNTRLESTL